VNKVSAVATCVAAGKQIHGGGKILVRLPGYHSCSAEKLRQDGRHHAGRERKGNERVEVAWIKGAIYPGANADCETNDDHRPKGNRRQHEVAANRAERGRAPGQEWAHTREEQQKQPDGNRYAIIKRCSDRNFAALDVFTEDGKERSPEDYEASGEQDKIVEEK